MFRLFFFLTACVAALVCRPAFGMTSAMVTS